MSAGKKHLLTPTQKEEFRRLVDECNHDLHEIARRMNLSFTKVPLSSIIVAQRCLGKESLLWL